MTRTASRWLWALGVVSVCGVVGLVLSRALPRPHGFALYNASTRVVGTVVDERTGQPLTSARVFLLRCEDVDDVEEQRREIQESLSDYGAAAEVNGGYGPVGRTDAQGRFAVTMRASYCTKFGPGVTEQRPPPFYAVGLIVVEKDGYVSTPFLTGHGTWQVLEGEQVEDLAYAQIDLPTLRLPTSE